MVDVSFDECEVSFPISFDNVWLKVYFLGHDNGFSNLVLGREREYRANEWADREKERDKESNLRREGGRDRR